MTLIRILTYNYKITFIAITVVMFIGYIGYVKYTLFYTKRDLEKASNKIFVAAVTKTVDVSDAINNVNFNIVSDDLNNGIYIADELPEGYIDPDFGKTYEFGAAND